MTEPPDAVAGLPLHGIRVVDLTMNIAGPYCTQILGDLGADVVKVERPDGGDDARRMVPRRGDGSAYFFAINRNKRSIALDIHLEADRAELLALLDSADVFVTNLRQQTLRRAELDDVHVRAGRPRLIYADISAYGAGGAESDRAGYDMVLQARSGLMSINGEPGRPPVRIGASILDMGSGLWLALGVVAALLARTEAAGGSRVSTSLLEVGASFMAYDLASYQLTGDVPGPRGSGHPSFGPYGVFQAADGFLAIGVGADRIFARLAGVLGRPELALDPRFASNTARMQNRVELAGILEDVLATLTVVEAVALLRTADVPADAVANAPTVLADPQLQALGGWVAVDAAGTTLQLPASPITFDGAALPLRRQPPPFPPA